MELARTLVRKGAIRPGVEVDARCAVDDLFGAGVAVHTRRYIVEECRESASGVLCFVALADKDGSRRLVQTSEVVAVMGMDPGRYALTFDVAPDGAEMSVGKRRGRKRKHPLGYRRQRR